MWRDITLIRGSTRLWSVACGVWTVGGRRRSELWQRHRGAVARRGRRGAVARAARGAAGRRVASRREKETC